MAATSPTSWLPAREWRSSAKWRSTAYSAELSMLHPEFEILTADDEEGDNACIWAACPIYEAAGK